MRPSLVAAIQEAPAQQTMADTVAVVARRLDEHEEHLCALQHAIDAEERVLTRAGDMQENLECDIAALEDAVFDAQGCTILEDFRLRLAALTRNAESFLAGVAGNQGAPLELVALQRELAVAEEIARLRREVEGLDEDLYRMTNVLAEQNSRRRGD